jgi:hypothetical protein
VRRVKLKDGYGETVYVIGATERQTIREMCVKALRKDPQNSSVVKVLRAVSPWDQALPEGKRRKHHD